LLASSAEPKIKRAHGVVFRATLRASLSSSGIPNREPHPVMTAYVGDTGFT
jgi:hypothetical protein